MVTMLCNIFLRILIYTVSNSVSAIHQGWVFLFFRIFADLISKKYMNFLLLAFKITKEVECFSQLS